jgi:hypothetical protein
MRLGGEAVKGNYTLFLPSSTHALDSHRTLLSQVIRYDGVVLITQYGTSMPAEVERCVSVSLVSRQKAMIRLNKLTLVKRGRRSVGSGFRTLPVEAER